MASTNNDVDEYAHAEMLRRQSLIEDNLDTPMRVNAVHVHGLRVTKDDLVEVQFEQALRSKTLGEIVQAVSETAVRVHRLDIFSEFSVELTTPEDVFASDHSIDVNVHVTEKSRIRAETGTYMGTSEGSVRASAGIRNLLGRAEKLEFQASASTSTKSSFALTFTKPMNGDPDRPLDFVVFQNQNDWTIQSGYEEKSSGLYLKYKVPTFLGNHYFSYEAAWRELSKLPRYASWAVREEAGHSLKSSVKHELVHDRSDNLAMPTSGYQLKLMQELAGLGGDVNFLKNEVNSKFCLPLGYGISTSLALQGGLMQPLADSQTRINDRFFLGGPLSVRGYRLRGLGPQAARNIEQRPPPGCRSDALGGEVYWAAGLSLFTPIPLPTLWNQQFLKLHAFANAGNLERLSSDASLQDGMKAVIANADVTAGLGVALHIQGARIEFNYCVPLHGLHADRRDSGPQLGIGLAFL